MRDDITSETKERMSELNKEIQEFYPLFCEDCAITKNIDSNSLNDFIGWLRINSK